MHALLKKNPTQPCLSPKKFSDYLAFKPPPPGLDNDLLKLEDQRFTFKLLLRDHWAQSSNLHFSLLHHSFVPDVPPPKGYLLARQLSLVPQKAVGIILPYTNKNTSAEIKTTEFWWLLDLAVELKVEDKGDI